MIYFNSITKLNYALSFDLLVINLLLIVRPLHCSPTNETAIDLDNTRNETSNSNNEIGDGVLLDKYQVSKELKYYLNAFNGAQRTNRNESTSSNETIILNNHNHNNSTNVTNVTNDSIEANLSDSISLLNSTINNSTINDSSTNDSTVRNDSIELAKTNESNSTQLATGAVEQNQTSSIRAEEREHLFKSLCSLTNDQVKGCERYECNKNTCYCSDMYDLSVNLKPSWPIKYLCLSKVNYNEDCLVDDQCSGKHQVCLNKKNFRNYLNYDLDVSMLNDKLESLLKTTNSTSELNRKLFVEQMSILYNQTKFKEYRGKCRCKSGFFYNYYLSYSNKNKHFNKQFNSFLIESNSSNVSDLFARQKNLFLGHCLRVRKIDEICELNSECQMNDPSSICKRSKCVCKTGYQIEVRNPGFNDQISIANQTNSILISKLTNSTSSTPSTTSSTSNATRLICEPILNLNLEINHHHVNRLLEKQASKNNPSSNYQQLSRNNGQMIKNILNKNCSDELIICEGGRSNCLKKSKRMHGVQENFASLVWTVLCMLSIMLVLCMLLVKNKQDDDGLELNHNYNNYFLRNSSISNLNHQTTSFFGSMFNRSHANSANATELQNINQQNLISCTPPPEFSEFDDQPPSYQEAIRLMQQKPSSLRDLSDQ